MALSFNILLSKYDGNYFVPEIWLLQTTPVHLLREL